MGMLYRRKQRNAAGVLVEAGPWWMKYYAHGRPIYESTGTVEKREANAMLKKAEHKVLEGHRVTSRTRRIKFDDLVTDLKDDSHDADSILESPVPKSYLPELRPA